MARNGTDRILRAAYVARGIAADGYSTRLTLLLGAETSIEAIKHELEQAQVWDETREVHGCTIDSQSLGPCPRWSIFTVHHPRQPTRFAHARNSFDVDNLVGGIRLAVPHGRVR